MTFPTTIQATVGQLIIHKATRLFAGCVADALHELLQNARRAGASRVDIRRLDQDHGTILRIRDDGRGIADPTKLLALGDSGWDSDITRNEDPAGMGVFSLAGRHVVIRSRTDDAEDGWQVTIPPQAWENGEPLDLVPVVIAKGTEIEIELSKAWADELGQAVKSAARFYPIPVFYGEERQAHEGFLKEAASKTGTGVALAFFSTSTRLIANRPGSTSTASPSHAACRMSMTPMAGAVGMPRSTSWTRKICSLCFRHARKWSKIRRSTPCAKPAKRRFSALSLARAIIGFPILNGCVRET